MSREIKFRAWDKVSQTMRYGAEHSLTMCLMNARDFELMEYTGLKDKNDTEIYEGDIMKHPFYPDNLQVKHFDEKYVSAFLLSPDGVYGLRSMDFPSSEVVGNIYGNKELLT